MYYRGYDGDVDAGTADKSNPATVNDFNLDKYEVTVARFRNFVDAGGGTQMSPPNAQTGWDNAWNTNLALDTFHLRTALAQDSGASGQCVGFRTWTNAVTSLPMNCVNWYEAFAFCVWDGGYLPSEAEWNYAAAGGTEQLTYPWGGPLTPNHASYGNDDNMNCYGSGGTLHTCTVMDLLPVGSLPKGNGKWGHSDLAGNVAEWMFDFAGSYPNPCVDCVNLTPGAAHIVRGGGFVQGAFYVRTTARNPLGSGLSDQRYFQTGIRCARSR
jgi:formylglycine-generating enzyme required for sulfatase activity